jgi:hypothetical protein
MNQEKKPFSVNDRRHFTAEGAVRTEVDDEPISPAAAGVASAPPKGLPPEPEEEGPVSFAGFVLSLGAQAGTLLSEVGNGGAEQKRSLAAVRSMIGILEMLQDKTQGRRTPDEDQILDGLLYQLRMGYVAAARAGGA